MLVIVNKCYGLIRQLAHIQYNRTMVRSVPLKCSECLTFVDNITLTLFKTHIYLNH